MVPSALSTRYWAWLSADSDQGCAFRVLTRSAAAPEATAPPAGAPTAVVRLLLVPVPVVLVARDGLVVGEPVGVVGVGVLGQQLLAETVHRRVPFLALNVVPSVLAAFGYVPK